MLISAVGRIIVVALAVFSVPAWSGQPSTETLAAYRRAVQGIERRGQDHDVRAALNSRSGRSGAAEAILVQRLAAQDVNGHNIRPEGALIHHWWAVMFIDNTRPEDVVAILTDYDHHARIYAPKVTFSKLLDKRGERYHVVRETLVRNLITVGLKIESVIDWSGDEQGGFSSHATTTHISEFEYAGTARARERSPEEAKGWMWAQDSWWHVTPQANGTCVTYETIALTRDIPWGFRWLLRPIIERFPAETLTQMLQLTRTAVQSRTGIQQVPDVSKASESAFPDRLRQRN